MWRGLSEKPEQIPEPSGDALERPGKFRGDGFEDKPQHYNRDGEYADDQLAQPPDDENGTEEDFEECAHVDLISRGLEDGLPRGGGRDMEPPPRGGVVRSCGWWTRCECSPPECCHLAG